MASYRKLPSGKWQAVVKHRSGKRYTKTDPLKRTVQEWASGVEADLKRGDFVDPRAGDMTLTRWWEKWQRGRVVAKATASKQETHWRVHIEPAFGAWPLNSIQPWDVREWVARKVKADTKPEALATAVRLLSQMLDAAVVDKKLRLNPAAGIKAPRPPKHVDRFLDIEEADRIVENITKAVRPPVGGRRDRAWERVPDPVNQFFVRLLLDAGLRWQEAAGLHHFRVDERRKRLRVQEVVEEGNTIKDVPKSLAGSRLVPLTDELVKLYRGHVLAHGREGLVFPGPDGVGPMDYDNWVKRVWAPAVAAAEVDDPQPTPHDCRHSYGSWLADQGVPPHEIMTLMGHASLRAVERYIHASKARMERARQALGARRAHEGESQEKRPRPAGGGNGA